MRTVQVIRDHTFAISGMLIGALIFALVFLRGEDTRKQVIQVKREVNIIRSTSPCTNLTRTECAVYLLEALPKGQRREIQVNEATLRRLGKQIERERSIAERHGSPQILVNGQKRPTIVSTEPSGSSVGHSESSGGSSGGSQPQPPPKPAPIAQTPPATPPPNGPVPAITVPSIIVPCIPAPPVISCPDS